MYGWKEWMKCKNIHHKGCTSWEFTFYYVEEYNLIWIFCTYMLPNDCVAFCLLYLMRVPPPKITPYQAPLHNTAQIQESPQVSFLPLPSGAISSLDDVQHPLIEPRVKGCEDVEHLP